MKLIKPRGLNQGFTVYSILKIKCCMKIVESTVCINYLKYARYVHECFCPQEKEKYRERYITEFLKPKLTYLQKMLEANNGGDGFFVGNSVCNLPTYIHYCIPVPSLSKDIQCPIPTHNSTDQTLGHT